MRLYHGPLIQVPGLSSKTARGDGTASVPRQCVVRRHADEQGVVVRIASSGMMVRQKRGRGRREWMTITASSSTLRRITTIWHHSKAAEHSSMARDQRCVAPASPY
jgi:hypothetical protein